MAVLKFFLLHILVYFSGMIVQLLGSTPLGNSVTNFLSLLTSHFSLNLPKFITVFHAELHVVSVATEETDGYRRMIRSASVYGVQVHVCFKLQLLLSYLFVRKSKATS